MFVVLKKFIGQQHFLTESVNTFKCKKVVNAYSENEPGLNPPVIVSPGFVPRFLSMLEEEVYSQNSPIWDQDFMVSSSQTGQLGIQTGNLHLVLC